MDIKVSNNHLENAPTDKLPQKEDGSLDYENMTIAQQFTYTCKTESLKVALKDLNADIKLLEKNIVKIKKEAASLYGSDRAKLRDSVRNEEQKLRELQDLRNKYTPKRKWNFILLGIIGCLFLCAYFFFSQEGETGTDMTEFPINNEILEEYVNTNKDLKKYSDTREAFYSYLGSQGYSNLGSLDDFLIYIKDSTNRAHIYNCLQTDGYKQFETQLELDAYLGYKCIVYFAFAENKKFHVSTSNINKFKKEYPSAQINYLIDGEIRKVSISDLEFINDKKTRPQLIIKIKKEYKGSQKRLLYYSLLASRYFSESEIGTISEFLNALDNKEKVKTFYYNLRNWGFLPSEIGTELEFWEMLKSDFEQPTDIQPRKYPKTQSTTSSLQVPASTEATWEETLFDTGDIPYLSHYGKGKYDYKSLSELKIINYSERDAVVLLENEAGNVVRNNYVDTGEIFHVKHIPAGNYIIKVMYGNSWNADKNNGAGYPKGGFMKNESFSSTQWNDSFNFYPEKTDEGTTYPTYSVTLHKVENGNLETKAINKADFFK